MTIPLISTAQVRMLAEGMTEPLPPCAQLPEDLLPRTPFSDPQIRQGLPKVEPFRLRDCRYFLAK
jgi:NADH dehydrogenase